MPTHARSLLFLSVKLYLLCVYKVLAMGMELWSSPDFFGFRSCLLGVLLVSSTSIN